MHQYTWKIFYKGGLTFSSADGEPGSAPGSEVQCILHLTEAGWLLMAGNEYYFWRDNAWLAANSFDALILYLSQPGWSKVLFTSEIKDDEYDQILAAANHERQALRA